MFSYKARVERDDRFGAVTLHLLRDDEIIELHNGDEFLTVTFDVDPYDRPPAHTTRQGR